jgi:hypothetical protein
MFGGMASTKWRPRRREIQIGARHWHGERVGREFGGIPLTAVMLSKG